VTPEAHYLRRREFLRVFGLGLAASALLPSGIRAESAALNDSLNSSYKLDGVKLTPEDLVISYNNFYEWGLAKDQPKELANRGWKTRPWPIEIGGSCANPRKIDVDELIQIVGPIERRNYRHRCVEAWSMVTPWDGFPLSKLVDFAQPKLEAKYVKFTSFFDPLRQTAAQPERGRRSALLFRGSTDSRARNHWRRSSLWSSSQRPSGINLRLTSTDFTRT
jgi:sulfoxide reductase catalytic subunit YedY